jgi:hypothetical protein
MMETTRVALIKEMSDRMVENMKQTVCKISCEKLSVDQLSMKGVAELQSNKTVSNSLSSSMSEDKSSKMSYEHNGMVSGQKCDLVIGQREGSSKKYVQNVTNLAKSRQIRCISADTKGGPSSISRVGQIRTPSQIS